MLLMSVAIVFLNTVIASGNTKITFMIEAGAIILYCIFIYTVLETFNLPVEYGWMSEWLYWTCLLLPSVWYIRSGRWKNKSI
jgi:Na+-driven multidrug efflux pump